ncbi:Metallo-hydrolase/oxidoreductase [Meredithblackwellia eburnea MCA 4105]
MPDYTHSLSVTFLGTAAGRPSLTRNVSSLAIKLDKDIWVVDAGEATQHQFMKSPLKMSGVTKLFITHLHGDHIFGLPGLLCTISAGEGSVLPDEIDPRLAAASNEKPTELYGPAGLRSFLRHNLRLSYSILSRPYVVHELLFEGEDADTSGPFHPSERQGRDIRQSGGLWRDFASDTGFSISAGPVLHTVPCIGYVFAEQARPLPVEASKYMPHLLREVNSAALKASGLRDPRAILSQLTKTQKPVTLADGMGGPGRKLVILGDTFDASPIAELAQDADLLVHECTNAYLPDEDEGQQKESVTEEGVEEVARSHGHSTTRVVGAFAKRIGAKGLVVNHLSVKYPDVEAAREGETEKEKVAREKKKRMLEAIARKVSESWGGGEAIVAKDLLMIPIPRKP